MMAVRRPEPPRSARVLRDRIRAAATRRGSLERRVARTVANTIVGQMLPPGVVKGGTAMKLRRGEANTRFTPDLDVTRAANMSVDDYAERLRDRLAAGWGGFTGTVAGRAAAQPEGVPEAYVMRPFDVRLVFNSSHWMTVRLELGHDEIGSAAIAEPRIAADIVELFFELGLDEPEPIGVLQVSHQVAQKLHACTWVNPRTGGNERAHDLVDLQLLEEDETIDLAELARVATRLFATRQEQSWPPTIVAHTGWTSIYAEAADGLEVLASVDEAVAWANELIARALTAAQAPRRAP
jgi:hypothetical protein